ncbi:UNVERIFIED_CONTAM: KIN14B-interacting protein [Sesamum angustifolium]|uniref:KIN14B-interacting protein n=1 Tax=Sesamum angustifolium TaxID=2727405 RepID=A0AAW2P307_9LAMI
MSTSSARRTNERGGGGAGRVAASTGKVTPVSGKSMSSGKENPGLYPGFGQQHRSLVSVLWPGSTSPQRWRRRSHVVSKDLEKNGGVLNELEGVPQENENIAITVVKNGVNEKKEGSLSSVTVKRSDLEKKVSKYLSKNGKTLDEMEGSNQQSLNMNIRVGSCSNEKKAGALSSISTKRSDHENLNVKSNSEYGAEVKSSEETRLRSSKENEANKYPNASKMILSDIQEKISGIEKAMGHVVGHGGDAKVVSLVHTETDDKEEENDVGDAKSLAKGLNVEELEARLFPHHKLIRDRTLSKATFGESNNTLDVEEDKVISFDVNVIDSGFLASLRNIDALLMADENLNDFDDQERVPTMIFDEEFEDSSTYQLNDIGGKSLNWWMVCIRRRVSSFLLMMMALVLSMILSTVSVKGKNLGICSYALVHEKAEYKPPAGFSPNTWRDCWVIRAPSADGCSGKYVVAASAGNSVDSGFCSWDFYTKDIRAFHFENETAHV